jgi:hypothetical protein
VNTWYNYTEKDGTYNLESEVARQIKDTTAVNADGSARKLDKENTTVDNGTDIAYGNDNSVFIAVKVDGTVTNASDGAITKVKDVTTGIQTSSLVVETYSALADFDGTSNAKTTPTNNPTKTNNDTFIYAVYNKNGYIQYAIVVGKVVGSSNRYVYLTSGITSKKLVDDDYIYSYDAITRDDGATTLQSFKAFDETTVAPAHTSTDLLEGNIYEATLDSNGVVTEMKWLDDNGTYNTATYKADGYMKKTVATGSPTELTVKGSTLYLNAQINNQYVLLDSTCRFFVHSSDQKANKYTEYGNISSALSALGTDTWFTGTIVALVNDAGIATTLILKDTYTANDTTTTNSNSVYTSTGRTESATVSGGGWMGGTVTVVDRYGTGKTIRELAIEAVTNAGFTVTGYSGSTYGDNGDTVYATNGLFITSWTVNATILYPVSLKTDATSVSITSPKTVYLGVGDTIGVSLRKNATWSSFAVTGVSGSEGGTYTPSNATQTDTRNATVKVTCTGITESETVTISVTP